MKEWVQKKKSAFLLIEQLMALAIFTVSMLLISGVYQVLLKVQNKLEVPNYIEWHLMATQLDTHLQGYAKNNNPELIEFVDQRTIKEYKRRIHRSRFYLRYKKWHTNTEQFVQLGNPESESTIGRTDR